LSKNHRYKDDIGNGILYFLISDIVVSVISAPVVCPFGAFNLIELCSLNLLRSKFGMPAVDIFIEDLHPKEIHSFSRKGERNVRKKFASI
jgi:hypothetical protein